MHRKVLEPDGVGLMARRVDDKKEFVASTDIWFRPAQFANAPDGNLYIIDVYREVIEHPASLPPVIKKHLDLTSGRDRGRIYRVVRDGFQQPPLPRLGKATTAELVATLAHRNGWHRDTAARLLFERRRIGRLRPLVKSGRIVPVARRPDACAVRAGRTGGALGGCRVAAPGGRTSPRSRTCAQTFGDAGGRFS